MDVAMRNKILKSVALHVRFTRAYFMSMYRVLPAIYISSSHYAEFISLLLVVVLHQ